MQKEKSFYDYIVELRRANKIPKQWRVTDIRPFLKDHFSKNTITVYPSNCSISVDGKIKGDYVKRGQKPKFYRVRKGCFTLVFEFDSTTRNKLTIAKIQGERKILRSLKDVFINKQQLMKYISICNSKFRNVSPSLILYKIIIEKHNNQVIDDLIEDVNFLEITYATLQAWNMDMRGAKLTDFTCFKNSITNLKNEIIELHQYKMHQINSSQTKSILSKIENIFRGIHITQNKSKIVGTSKLLHFLVPDLIMPVDRTYTMSFIYGHNKYSQEIAKEIHTFNDIFRQFYNLTKKLSLTDQDIDGLGWNTTIPKLIDNAIMGFVMNNAK